jgi:UbiD family decarboxylase
MAKERQMVENLKPVQDLRDWLSRVRNLGELLEIDEPVDCIEEMSAISYLVSRRAGAPAILFNRAAGFEGNGIAARLLWNLLGLSRQRIALTLEEPAETGVSELIVRTKKKLGCRIPPVEIAGMLAPVYENSLVGDEINLESLPIPKHWPRDGGAYAGTADAVITRDPETGYLNVGTYRMMIQGPRQVGLYLSPGKDALLHIQKAWSRGQSLPIAAAWGIDPLLMIVGSQSFPKNASEYDYAGGIKGRPVELVKATTSDLMIPAFAEFVIEGFVHPGATKAEGPFGEFTGYYGRPEAECPLVEVTAVHHRHKPLLTNALMAASAGEQSGLFSIIRSAKIWDDFDKLGVPGIIGVYSHPAAASGFGMTAISIDQKYAGHAAQVLGLAAQMPGGAYFTKWIIAVDADVDPTDFDQVIWAMATRCNPIDDIDVLRNTWSTSLDPSQNPPEKRPYGSKALINACKEHRHLQNYPAKTALRREIYDRVKSRWLALNLPGTIPQVSLFD